MSNENRMGAYKNNEKKDSNRMRARRQEATVRENEKKKRKIYRQADLY